MKNILLLLCTILIVSCIPKEKEAIKLTNETITAAISALEQKQSEQYSDRITRGVKHAASLWRETDGTASDFQKFCEEQFIASDINRSKAFDKLSRNFEILLGYQNKISLDLLKPLHEPGDSIIELDQIFGGYNSGAHLSDDLYDNKIAFIIALNFPFYSLDEKEQLGKSWSRQQWAYARLGDMFTARVPATLTQKASEVGNLGDIYISDYNIYAGNLRDSSDKALFSSDLVLLSHWNLRDEIKANYANNTDGLEKQALIYKVMTRIVDQSIPKSVINSNKYLYNPYFNEVIDGDSESAKPENNERYQQIINNFQALKAMDAYSPLNTFIKRSFEGGMELKLDDAKKIFTEFLTSPVLKDIAGIVQKRLGRDLQPWDIWYDGFKARSLLNEDLLTQKTQTLYPNAAAFEKALPSMLKTLGFEPDKAAYICDKISVDPARGSGHAWGAVRKGEKAHLRTRIPETGMNYKGYNIAVHEFGHNVEQTISLYEMDYYLLNGVPNTAFTEALAFVFQKRDLQLLGMANENPMIDHLNALDLCWSAYEIMGVSLVDIQTWEWLYAHPDATAEQLKEAVIANTKEIWNKYYAPVFGVKDATVLGVYSHMISNPLYLSNYAIGNLIEFQLEAYLKNKPFANEVERIYMQGRLTPNEWMEQAVGSKLSSRPLLNAAKKAVTALNH